MRRRRFAVSLSVLLVLAGVLAGCATVPKFSPAQAIPVVGQERANDEARGPEQNANPPSLVRSFVETSGDPQDDYASARAFLATAAAESWNPHASVTIIADPFDTVPSTEGSRGDDTRTVILRGKTLGSLAPDGRFVPHAGDYQQPIRLRRQPNGQWRIVDPPPGIVITVPEFLQYYHHVRVFYFDKRLGIPVPDLRYAAAGSVHTMASEVIDLLLAGPSDALRAAVRSAIPRAAVNKGSVAAASDGALLVNLAKLGEQRASTKKKIAAQVVLSLQSVTNRPIRLQSDGEPMFYDHPDWRPSDLPSYESTIVPGKDQHGLVVADGRLRELGNGTPAPGPAGSGDVPVVSAAQSIDGTRLAVVATTRAGVILRIGRYGQPLAPTDLTAGTLTRPTWAPGNASAGYYAWTVANGRKVYRIGSTGGGWRVRQVDARALNTLGNITDLRLSRDGARVAAVIDGKLVVGAVALSSDGPVRIDSPRVLQAGTLTSVTSVAWKDQDTLVVATTNGSRPVVRVPVDGLETDTYEVANLRAPVPVVAAAPHRPVVVADQDGLWTATDTDAVWSPNRFNPGSNAIPFYPG